MAYFLSVFFCFLFFTDIYFTTSLICLKWNIHKSELVLTCKINHLNLEVSFLGPNLTEVAHCLMPIPNPYCRSNYGNVTQDIAKNETSFTVGGVLNDGMNGEWSCLHGWDNEKAVTIVTVPTKGKLASSSPFWNLSIQKYIKRDQQTTLKCSTKNINDPLALSNVTFFVNDKPYAYFHQDEFGCQGWKQNRLCVHNECNCTDMRTGFVSAYNSYGMTGVVKFSCTGNTNLQTEYSDCDFSRIIDINGPTITPSVDLPVLNGTDVLFSCSSEVKHHIVKLDWNCLNTFSNSTSKNNSEYIVQPPPVTVTSANDNELCNCRASIDGIHLASTSVRLMTKKIPILLISRETKCESSQAITLTCSVVNVNDFSAYGFSAWIHFRNGKFVRHLGGVQNGFVTLLYILNCKHADVGEYTCQVWGMVLGTKVWSNQSVHLFVEHVEDKERSTGSLEVYIPYIVTGSIVLLFILLVLLLLQKRQSQGYLVREPIIYHAAPSLHLVNTYNSTNSHYSEIDDVNIQQEELTEYEEIDKVDISLPTNEPDPDYLEPC